MVMAPGSEPRPLTSLAALHALPALSTVALRRADCGAHLTIDEGNGSLGVSPALTPSALLTLCLRPGTDGVGGAFLSSSAAWALGLDKGWLSTSVTTAKRDRKPLQLGDFFSLDAADGHQPDQPLPFFLTQEDQYVAWRGDGGLSATVSRQEAAAFHMLCVVRWPFAVEILTSFIRFDRPAGKPDLVSAWDGRAIRHSFEIEEGTWQTETLHFRVHRRVTNLRQVTTTTKLGITVNTTTTPLGSFDVAEEPYSFTFPRNEVPEGCLVRGWYAQTALYESDEGVAFLPTHSDFQIVAKAG